MYIAMDMGTSNTRVWLRDQKHVCHFIKMPVGASATKSKGKPYLFSELKTLICSLLEEAHTEPSEVQYIIASGMIGSELGISEVPRLSLPVSSYHLSQNLHTCTVPEISTIPFLIVPGLKKCHGIQLLDAIRGEETEVTGITLGIQLPEDTILILPGTHNKIIRISKGQTITDFYTTMSGELLHSIISGTILSGSTQHQFTPNEQFVLQGAAYGKENGVNAALFRIRIMSQNGMEVNALSSFLYGCILGQDIDGILKFAQNAPILVGGNEILKQVYCILLGEKATPISEEIASEATGTGLWHIYQIYQNIQNRNTVLNAITEHKLIAILRDPDPETLLPATQALYNGGIRLIEVTFDRSGNIPKAQTAALIHEIKANTSMLVGAGTVTSQEELQLAYQAGASFIISPNCDNEIIEQTRNLGLVSIPAAFTPTEIANAIRAGADYIKLFPADALPKGYAKAVKAPLSDARLLAVGGVTEHNAKEYITAGFSGLGIGSGLYNKELIHAQDWEALTALAEKYVSAVHID